MRIAVTGILMLSMTAGCCSIRTNMWTRAEDDSLHLDPCQDLNGMPVMLKVPSHIEVKIIETLYAAHNPSESRLDVVRLKRPDLRTTAELKYTEKMFLVDPVRVAAGTGAYGFGFAPLKEGQSEIFPDGTTAAGSSSGHGYLHSATYKADDQTIAKAGELLGTVLGFNRGQSAPGIPASLNLVTIDRVVAFRRFDLASCDCDQQIQCFMETHMNQCSASNRGFVGGDVITAPESSGGGGGGENPVSGSINIQFGAPPTPPKSE